MNAQRSVWTSLTPVPLRMATYAGGYFDVDSGLVHLWFCDDTLRRVAYKKASIPDDVLRNISYERSGQRYYAPLRRAVSCTQDGLFLFAVVVVELDRLYYVVVNKNATEWRSGSVSLSQFRPPGGQVAGSDYEIRMTDAGRWTWDGRTFTCLLRVRGESGVPLTEEYVTFCSLLCLKRYYTIDDRYDHFIVQIDTSSGSITAYSSAGVRGSSHHDYVEIRDAESPVPWRWRLMYYSETIESDVPSFPRFVGKTDVVYIRSTGARYSVIDECRGFRSFSSSGRRALVYAGTEVLSSEDPNFLAATTIMDTVVEHTARSGVYILSNSRAIIGHGTRIIGEIPTGTITVGIHTIYMLLLTTIGASDDAKIWEGNLNIVGATDDTISVFFHGASKRMVIEEKDREGFTTWWLLTISLSTGRVVQEVKLEPVDIHAPIWDVEAEGVTRAMPMISLLDGGQFRNLKR
jgi:hypothetical protein